MLNSVTKNSKLLSYIWLAILVLGFGFAKFNHAIAQRSIAIDGGFYTDIAIHVRDGLGLRTNLSLYHQAFSYFPHETAISPLWPLFLGYISRFTDVYWAGVWIPAFLYMLALVAGYFWASRLFPEPLFPLILPGFGASHIFVFMLGAHKQFFIFTSVPYQEGLSFALLGIALWRFHSVLKSPSLGHGLEVGIWLSVLFLARSQMMIIAIAVYLTLMWGVLALPNRKQQGLMFVGALTSFLVILGTYYMVFVEPFFGASAPTVLLRFDQSYESTLLSEFDPMVKVSGLDYLRDRLGGIPIAFGVSGRFAYAQSFYIFQYATPAFLICIIALGLKKRKEWKKGLQILRTVETQPWIMVILFSLGSFTAIYLVHFDYFIEWYFSNRQGTLAVYIFFLSLIYLLRQKNFWKALGIMILCSSVYVGVLNIKKDSDKVPKKPGQGPQYVQRNLVKWLNTQGKITIAMTAQDPQRIGHLTSKVGYHWIYNKSTPEDIELMTTKLGAKYVVLSRSTLKWRFRKGSYFSETFTRIKTIGGVGIYVRKDSQTSEPPD